MENKDYHNIWKDIDSEINLKSKDELNLLFISKTKKTINKFLYVIGFSIFVCAGLIAFLVTTALNRKNDIFYQVNNLVICLVAIIALISSLYEWYIFQNNRFNQPLKNWLEERIDSLNKSLTGRYSKLYLFLIPILYLSITLSIHVYFKNKLLIEVLKTEDSVISLIVSAPIGLFVSYYCSKKIRKYYWTNLEYLKGLHERL